MGQPSTCFQNVSKLHRIGPARTNLREALAGLPRRLFSPAAAGDDLQRHLWALRRVSFEVGLGEVLGIIGPNGASKTTVLKLLPHVTYPTEGQIHPDGRISALIELEAGFHPDLTGRENIYLNGAIL